MNPDWIARQFRDLGWQGSGFCMLWMFMSMWIIRPHGAWLAAGVLVLSGCGGAARLPVSAGVGPNPTLPPPRTSLLPTVHVATATGWPADAKPAAAPTLAVNAFARDLDHPRWLYVLPNGDVLVAETNGPPKSSGYGGIKGWFFKRYQKKAGGGVPSANRITLLRDADGDGVAETRSVLLDGLNSPFGMALIEDTLYVANADALVRVPYAEGQTRITAPVTKVTDFPSGPLNHHWTKSLIASADGTRLYVGIGSNSNIAEHGMDKEERRAAIWEIDALTGRARVFASGGYKVIFIPFADGRPSGTPIDVLIGFVREEEDEAMGRPVGVVIDRMGALLVADDVGNAVWRVAAAAPGSR